VVQLARDRPPLTLLRREEARREGSQALPAGLDLAGADLALLLRLAPLGEIADGGDREGADLGVEWAHRDLERELVSVLGEPDHRSSTVWAEVHHACLAEEGVHPVDRRVTERRRDEERRRLADELLPGVSEQ